jgi:hypothetical protein
MLAAVIPLPSEEVTPPVTKTYFDIGLAPPGVFLMLPEEPIRGKAAVANAPGPEEPRPGARDGIGLVT